MALAVPAGVSRSRSRFDDAPPTAVREPLLALGLHKRPALHRYRHLGDGADDAAAALGLAPVPVVFDGPVGPALVVLLVPRVCRVLAVLPALPVLAVLPAIPVLLVDPGVGVLLAAALGLLLGAFPVPARLGAVSCGSHGVKPSLVEDPGLRPRLSRWRETSRD